MVNLLNVSAQLNSLPVGREGLVGDDAAELDNVIKKSFRRLKNHLEG
jgi:hypothetical protein